MRTTVPTAAPAPVPAPSAVPAVDQGSAPVPRRRRAFTLIELIVAMVILSILVTLSMFGARSFLHGGYNTEAKARLNEVTQLEQALAKDWGQYSDFPADLSSLSGDTELTFHTATQPKLVSAAVGDGGTLGLAVRSASGKCYYARVLPLLAGGDARDVTASVPASAPCAGAESLPDGEAVARGTADPVSIKDL